jgi:O-methyltransferase
MEMSIFNIIQLFLLAILVIFGIYYFYSELFGRNYEPLIWKEEVRKGNISTELFKASKQYSDKNRFFNFWFQVKRLKDNNIDGMFAELGVYKGETANIIHLMDTCREFHLYDTFEGFQKKDLENETGKAATYTTHNFADTSIEQVSKFLSHENFIFHKGYFPKSSKKPLNKKFALVNMDVDLYNPTKAGLEYFYPLMEKKGVILIHDHNPDWPGIMKAIDEFSQNIPETFIQLNDKDSTIMLIKL